MKKRLCFPMRDRMGAPHGETPAVHIAQTNTGPLGSEPVPVSPKP